MVGMEQVTEIRNKLLADIDDMIDRIAQLKTDLRVYNEFKNGIFGETEQFLLNSQEQLNIAAYIIRNQK